MIWPQGQTLRWWPVYPWPCLRCEHLGFSVTIARTGAPDHGETINECTVPSHHYIMLASMDAGDCADFSPKVIPA